MTAADPSAADDARSRGWSAGYATGYGDGYEVGWAAGRAETLALAYRAEVLTYMPGDGYVRTEFATVDGEVRDYRLADFDRWLAAHDAEVKAEALREAARAAVTEDEGIAWDDDYDRATVAAWLRDRADRLAGGVDWRGHNQVVTDVHDPAAVELYNPPRSFVSEPKSQQVKGDDDDR